MLLWMSFVWCFFLLFEQLVTKHACFCLGFSPSPIPCLSNAAGAEENKPAGVEEAEVEAGLLDHKCLSPLDLFSPEYIGKLYQPACKYIEDKNPREYLYNFMKEEYKQIHWVYFKLWMLKIIQCEKSTQLFYSFYSFLWSYSVTMLK